MLARPTFRNLTDSFESWAYQKGLRRQIAALQQKNLLEPAPAAGHSSGQTDRALRLTEAGRLHALGGRDPERQWNRPWDGQWRLVLFDLPNSQAAVRDRLRRFLRLRGFGYLQNSVWISPDPLDMEATAMAGATVNVESLLVLVARPATGESDEEIVRGAWDFTDINLRYARYMKILETHRSGMLGNAKAARVFRNWAAKERAAWMDSVSRDPLLPKRLRPAEYLGCRAWEARQRILAEAAHQIRSFTDRKG